MKRVLSSVVVTLLAAGAFAGTAQAHVDYVSDDPETATEVVEFVVSTLTEPFNAALVGGTVLAVAVVGVVYFRYRPMTRDVAAFRETMRGYRDLVPWLLRISIGIPLIGAGFGGYFFSPSVAVEARVLQVALGFLLLFGLASRAVAAVGILVYLGGLAVHPKMLLANEFVGGFLAILLVGSGRPSADHVFQEMAAAEGTLYGRLDPVGRLASAFQARTEALEPYLPTLLRVGLGLNFVYLGVTQKLMNPDQALLVVAKYDLTAVVPVDAALWVVGAGLAEAVVGVLVLVGFFTRGASMVALGLFTTTLFGLPDDPVVAHISLFGLASVLLITGGGPFSVDERLGASVSEGLGRGDAVAAD